jgi:hypothetical protein
MPQKVRHRPSKTRAKNGKVVILPPVGKSTVGAKKIRQTVRKVVQAHEAAAQQP